MYQDPKQEDDQYSRILTKNNPANTAENFHEWGLLKDQGESSSITVHQSLSSSASVWYKDEYVQEIRDLSNEEEKQAYLVGESKHEQTRREFKELEEIIDQMNTPSTFDIKESIASEEIFEEWKDALNNARINDSTSTKSHDIIQTCSGVQDIIPTHCNHSVNQTSKSNEIRRGTLAMEALQERYNSFAFNIFSKLTNLNNIFFSPFSIASALALCYVGAKNETRDELKKLLKIDDMDEIEINEANSIINLNMQNDLLPYTMANKVFCSKKFNINNEYVELIKQNYSGEIERLDFSNREQSCDLVNNWVSEKTKNKIDRIVNEETFNEAVSMFLVNAIYFKGSWLKSFNENDSIEKPFYLIDGSVKVTKFMRLFGSNLWVQELDEFGLNASRCSFPFNDNNTHLSVILPNSINDLYQVESKINNELFKKILSAYEDAFPNTDVLIPKFKFEFDQEISSTLSELGAKKMFSGQADFSGISMTYGLKIDEVIHRAVIDINEKGAEAAAASAIRIVPLTSMPSHLRGPLKVFNCDRPFIFIIHNVYTNQIIFMGKYMNPN